MDGQPSIQVIELITLFGALLVNVAIVGLFAGKMSRAIRDIEQDMAEYRKTHREQHNRIWATLDGVRDMMSEIQGDIRVIRVLLVDHDEREKESRRR